MRVTQVRLAEGVSDERAGHDKGSGLLNVLDLFSGIGGFSLGLERAGMRTVAFCEIEPYARAVLAKHWPGVSCYPDIRRLSAARLAADGISVDVICGGFPCQDISKAGSGAGLGAARSGLWGEFARLIGELRPRFVIVENVSALLGRGIERVLGDLAEIGYDAEWHCIPAYAVGAPHARDRVWIVAYANSERLEGEHGKGQSPWHAAGGCNDASRCLLRSIAPTDWLPEPRIRRVVDEVPNRMDRLRCLGNSIVPQIAEEIGRAIMRAAA